MYLLYQILGISAIIGATFCVLTMLPLQFIIGKAMSKNAKKASVSAHKYYIIYNLQSNIIVWLIFSIEGMH